MIIRYQRCINGITLYAEIQIEKGDLGEIEISYDAVSDMYNMTVNDSEWICAINDAVSFAWGNGVQCGFRISRVSGLLVDTDYRSVFMATISAIERLCNIKLGDELEMLHISRSGMNFAK